MRRIRCAGGRMHTMTLPSAAVASLPMYDLVELRGAHDALWAAVVDAFGPGLPAHLTHADDVHALWHAPQMAVSQSCGWPLVAELDGRVRTIGAFAYDVAGASPGEPRYRSRLVMRAGHTERAEPAMLVAAVNSFESLSGWLSLVRAFPDLDGTWPGDVVETGAHVASLATLRAGDADIAAIDGVTFALVTRWRPALLEGLVVVDDGPLIPCLPLVANASVDDDELHRLRAAFAVAVDALDPQHRDVLRITGFHPLGASEYESVRAMAVVWEGARR